MYTRKYSSGTYFNNKKFIHPYAKRNYNKYFAFDENTENLKIRKTSENYKLRKDSFEPITGNLNNFRKSSNLKNETLRVTHNKYDLFSDLTLNKTQNTNSNVFNLWDELNSEKNLKKKWFIKSQNQINYGPFSNEEIYVYLKTTFNSNPNSHMLKNSMIIDSDMDIYFKPDSALDILENEIKDLTLPINPKDELDKILIKLNPDDENFKEYKNTNISRKSTDKKENVEENKNQQLEKLEKSKKSESSDFYSFIINLNNSNKIPKNTIKNDIQNFPISQNLENFSKLKDEKIPEIQKELDLKYFSSKNCVSKNNLPSTERKMMTNKDSTSYKIYPSFYQKFKFKVKDNISTKKFSFNKFDKKQRTILHKSQKQSNPLNTEKKESLPISVNIKNSNEKIDQIQINEIFRKNTNAKKSSSIPIDNQSTKENDSLKMNTSQNDTFQNLIDLGISPQIVKSKNYEIENISNKKEKSENKRENFLGKKVDGTKPRLLEKNFYKHNLNKYNIPCEKIENVRKDSLASEKSGNSSTKNSEEENKIKSTKKISFEGKNTKLNHIDVDDLFNNSPLFNIEKTETQKSITVPVDYLFDIDKYSKNNQSNTKNMPIEDIFSK